MVRAALACALVGGFVAVLLAQFGPLASVLAPRGITVAPDSVFWLDPPGLAPRRALFLAHEPNEPNDVYVITARTGGNDRIIRVLDVSNLTRSRDADEAALVVNGGHAAFATRVAGEIVAVYSDGHAGRSHA